MEAAQTASEAAAESLLAVKAAPASGKKERKRKAAKLKVAETAAHTAAAGAAAAQVDYSWALAASKVAKAGRCISTVSQPDGGPGIIELRVSSSRRIVSLSLKTRGHSACNYITMDCFQLCISCSACAASPRQCCRRFLRRPNRR